MIELYQYEGCPHSWIVRAKLSELGLDYICHNAPPGRPDKDKVLIALSGDAKVPFMIDPDKGIYLKGEASILPYLEENYG